MNRRFVACVMLVFLVAMSATALAGCFETGETTYGGTLKVTMTNISNSTVEPRVIVVFNQALGESEHNVRYVLEANTHHNSSFVWESRYSSIICSIDVDAGNGRTASLENKTVGHDSPNDVAISIDNDKVWFPNEVSM